MNIKEEFKNLITTQGNRKSLVRFSGNVKVLRKYLQALSNSKNMETIVKTNKAIIDAINRGLDLPTLEQLLK